jgi:hypothetical protein
MRLVPHGFVTDPFVFASFFLHFGFARFAIACSPQNKTCARQDNLPGPVFGHGDRILRAG